MKILWVDDDATLLSSVRSHLSKLPDQVHAEYASNGIDAAIPFVCAVYEDSSQNTHNVVYRGSARTIDASRLDDYELVTLDDIPWSKLADNPLQQLLRRYLDEMEQDAFGLYVGDNLMGNVHPVKTGG